MDRRSTTATYPGTNIAKKSQIVPTSCKMQEINNLHTSDSPYFNKLAVSSNFKKTGGKNEGQIFKKRAKAKFITNGFIIDLASLKSPLEQSYWNTFHCVETLLYDQENGKMTGKYCKNRWCLVCNRIRTGKLMNKYFDRFIKYDDLFFVTLTVRNVPIEKLPECLNRMGKIWDKIRFKFKYRGINFDGIRKSECTYNNKENTFHPHFHVVIRGREQAELLLQLWMKLNKEDTDIKGQDIRKCDTDTLKELFKYFTKIVKRDKTTDKNEYQIFIKPLDLMNQAYYKNKIFNPFGIFRKKEDSENDEDIEELQAEILQEIRDGSVWAWIQTQSDWVSEYGEYLTANNYHAEIKVIIK